MQASMQDWPLRVTRILDHAARFHPRRPVFGRTAEGGIGHSDWSALRGRALRVAQALERTGVGQGDVVGVMGWNSVRLMEVWYGVPGAGAVLHTLNPRLFPDQLAYILSHAGDRAIFVDPDLLPIVERLRPELPGLAEVIVLCDAASMPTTDIAGAAAYEDWLAQADGDHRWADGDERDACGLCYTSGTTGRPKGVAYSHRSNVLHAFAAVAPDALGLSSGDTVMPVVPLFHANGWSLGYSAPMAGAAMALPGRALTAPALYELLEMGVTVTAAVPTVWLALLEHLEREGLTLSSLNRVVIGGSSCPRAVIERFQDRYGIRVLHAWGMTEMSPLGTVCSFKPEVAALAPEERLSVQETVGHPPFTVDLKITNDEGADLPWNGTAQGRLWARGDAVLRRYLKAETDATDPEGWLDTGDMATIDANGYVRITDRSKDVIKSGGEWISSIELENAAVGHPDVAEAAAIGIAHPKWGERPVLVVVLRDGHAPDPGGILAHMAGRFAKWQLPDDVVFLPEIPHTATGKISKLTLRERLAAEGYSLPA